MLVAVNTTSSHFLPMECTLTFNIFRKHFKVFFFFQEKAQKNQMFKTFT